VIERDYGGILDRDDATPKEVLVPPEQDHKGTCFRALHEGAPFVIPNPWDAGSAKVLAALGFTALASTSSGLAFTLGRADGSVTLDEVVAHARAVDEATALPVSMDLERLRAGTRGRSTGHCPGSRGWGGRSVDRGLPPRGWNLRT